MVSAVFLFLLFVDTLVVVLAFVVPVFKNPLKTRVCDFCDAAFFDIKTKVLRVIAPVGNNTLRDW